MRFGRLWLHDLKNGIGRRGGQYLLLLVPLTLLFCRELQGNIQGWQLIREEITTKGTWGTWILFLFQGMDEYIPSPEEPFIFPSMWVLLFLSSGFLSMGYPLNDLAGVGQQTLMRSGGRAGWWLSKCVWNFCSTLFCFSIILSVVTLFCLAKGIPLRFALDEPICQMLLESYEIPRMSTGQFLLWLVLFPFLFSWVLNLLQMVLGLVLSMVWGFGISAAVLLVSAYWKNPWILGNYAMFRRSEVFLQTGGMEAEKGLLLLLGSGILLTIAGVWIFQRYDILSRE